MTVATPTTQLHPTAVVIRLAIAVIGLCVATVVVGLALVGSSGAGIAQPLDDSIRSWSNLHLSSLAGVASLLSAIGATPLLLAASIAVSTAIVIRTNSWARGLLPVVSVLVVDIVGAVAKVLVGRPRPTSEGIGFLEHYSFPSGHTGAAAALAAALFLLWIPGRSKTERRFAALIVAAVVVSVSVGRVVIDAHWASDVIAASVLGVASAISARWALRQSELNADPEQQHAPTCTNQPIEVNQ